MTLSEEIRITRKKALLSQEAFAVAMGVSVASIIRWENGKSKPGLSAMKKLKTFCVTNNIDYSILENVWLNYNKEIGKNGNSQ